MVIKESLTIYIKDPDGKVTIRVIKPLREDMSLLDKILVFLKLKKYPGTLQAFGLQHAARLFGNVGSPLAIDQIGAYAGSWTWKSATLAYEATGILVVDNEANPWATGATYTKVGCRNSGAGANTHNEITLGVNLSGSPDITWWAEIKFVFT